MKKITVEIDRSREDESYYPVTDEDGNLRCSCGSELVKLDENTYRCGAGWPMYSFDLGEVIIDKFGNLMMKKKEH